MAQNDRDILFANESFVIGVFQAVAGASLVAALSQAEALIKYTGRFWFAGFLTAMAIALLSAVLAAYWKHLGRQSPGECGTTSTGRSEGSFRLREHLSFLDAQRDVCRCNCNSCWHC
jgi:hypothetical protein